MPAAGDVHKEFVKNKKEADNSIDVSASQVLRCVEMHMKISFDIC